MFLVGFLLSLPDQIVDADLLLWGRMPVEDGAQCDRKHGNQDQQMEHWAANGLASEPVHQPMAPMRLRTRSQFLKPVAHQASLPGCSFRQLALDIQTSAGLMWRACGGRRSARGRQGAGKERSGLRGGLWYRRFLHSGLRPHAGYEPFFRVARQAAQRIAGCFWHRRFPHSGRWPHAGYEPAPAAPHCSTASPKTPLASYPPRSARPLELPVAR